MKIIIAGSRTLHPSNDDIDKAMEQAGCVPSVIISGTAKGVDTAGEHWARSKNIPVAQIPADWNRYGKQAGHIRNGAMALLCDCAIILWNGQSPGTANLIGHLKRLGKPFLVFKQPHLTDV